ncbi:MAG: nucleoside-diphosphate sugar epimerase/dehydratase [Clostridia bacterium]|jgi:FlaA1/EpsC-like NDP-sugar epimerase|nr:nucleoside-diphosphate sugar epimerase/dehydratase [Clostridia bacterium]
MKEIIKKNRNVLLILIDILIIISCYIASILFLNVPIDNIKALVMQIAVVVIVYQIFLNIFHMYQNMMRYEVGKDYIKYIISAFLSMIILSIVYKAFSLEYINLKVNVLSGVLIAGTFVMYRLAGRSILSRRMSKYEKINKNQDNKANNLLIIGAGMGAREIIIAIKNNMRDKYNIVGIIDDDISKINHYILGIKVLGTRYDIPKIAKEKNVDLIFFAINKIDAVSRKKILEICQETGVKTRVLPTTLEVIAKQGAMNSLRDVQIEDLLGRDPVHLDNKNINSLIKNKTVLVTGGGGSIGSELCRQIVKYDPKRLVILDIYENNLYDIEMELRAEYPKLNLEAIVASVRDKARLNNVFETYKPEIVFHAAAHKHVPLMEKSPLEAIHNNVFGTYNVVNCADEYGVEKFVLISTDKAVNPTNIMGASKRVCEMIVQAKNKVSKTEYVAVRFGNVLGSNGSVIPLFKKQIERGGPVTVTHKDITRFFMTIPEAVQLILQAVTYAKGGEIFVLDMGEPVKIYDLAVSLIKLLGYEPNVDIPIEITGLRPGEKLYEEILMSEEGLTSTKHDKIFISKPMHMEMTELEEKLELLKELEYNGKYSNENIKNTMKEVVTTYKEPEEVNNKGKGK